MFTTLLRSQGVGGGVTGNLAANESGADSLSAEGVVKVAGSLAATETGSDTFAATGSAASGTVTGNLIAVESGADAMSAAGVVLVVGALAASESGADSFAGTGSAVGSITGSMSATESGVDTFFATNVSSENLRYYGSGKQGGDDTEAFVRKWWEYEERDRAPIEERVTVIERETVVDGVSQFAPDPAYLEFVQQQLREARAAAPTPKVTATFEDDLLMVIAIAEADDWP